MFIVIKKSKLVFSILIIVFFSFTLSIFCMQSRTTINENNNEEITKKVEEIFNIRNEAILTNNEKDLEKIYNKNTKYGLWAYEHEIKKLKYLHNWSEKQGVEFTSIKPNIKIRNIKGKDDTYSVNLSCSTEYMYMYVNNISPNKEKDKIDYFRIGTSHSLRLQNKDGNWFITKEWYTDPFADSLNLDNLKTKDIKEYIASKEPRDFSDLNKRRLSALEYADKFCGTANKKEDGFKYNSRYRNYNPLGGDCANFASQILHEGGNFRKTGGWNYDKSGGTRSWLNANGFKDYMLGSGRGSLIAHGNYNKIYKASYKLQPGDFVAYEKKGKVTHISVVTGADSKGYTLVNCHNTDRYRVPWDLGWSNKKIKFWLVRVHF